MNTAEVAVSKMQRDSGFQIRQLLAELIGESGKAPKLRSIARARVVTAVPPVQIMPT